MTRILGLTLLFLFGEAATAAELPVREGHRYCGDALDISAGGVGGEDFYCEAVAPATETGAIILICDHSDPSYGPPWVETARIVEDVIGNTLSYDDSDTYRDNADRGSITLRPCP